ncbi:MULTISPECIES: TetR/AcrR family transcriptional regulator [Paenibacillus]|jgi:AcrR family transcriptional regulator|uniref:HTH-type protein SlmA n=1 Tax=Paenibacillus polymyxa TaxID=1406 RepID=A0A378Y6J6_PAEPO|nr:MULTISPECIES: TetR family transcriptional regulator [Paenibacillus]AUS29280.1 transcriptional regulator [Paenibacillus polymyxa]KAE8561878.1 TetR family transcriptional regulator [Paenibacillus polymyxa]KAF6586980.1 TetR family transcriptional regulator [Paenibacillus sp. EKM211P]KAF6621472.1 TetR family transcriptional regulator [Paenibacillus sp. EKM101P]KAF6622777.1 TetR family transcriptional regulator [Paenibacillus sp. EKM102P]
MEKSSDILTKEQILIATEDTLRRFGVTKSSVTDVAKVLGVSHGTIYRHFKSKAELLEGVTEKWLNEKIIDPLTEICQDSSVLGISHLKRYIQTLVELKQYYARDDEEMFEMYTRVTEQAADLIDQHIAHIVDQLADIIVRGGITADQPPQLARTLFYATARFHHPAHAYEWKNPTIDQEFAEVWMLLEKGIS